jgi:N-methylhydantoinase A
MAVRIGIDTGGTFTDLVGFDEETRRFVYAKSASTPGEPSAALTAVLSDPQLHETGVERIVVGTTVATNAVLQRSGARVIFVTTAGFEDVPFIGRMDKAELYNLNWKKPKPLAARSDCFGVRERVTPDGEVLVPLDESSLRELVDFVRVRMEDSPELAVAVSLLFSYVRPEHELAIGTALRTAFPALPVSLSHEVAPIWREYERGSTTIGDAFVKPIMRDYVAGVRKALQASGRDAPVSMLKSNGGHLGLDQAPAQPAQFLLSGLAGGIVAARTYAKLAGVENVFSLDMGGTSADIGTIQGGSERSISEFEVGFGIPIVIPSVDVATLGAGGGSIAWVDKGGLLQVGPESAGAEPGPMCYGKGGDKPTTTDANLALGRLDPGYFLGGRVPLDPAAALPALRSIGLALGADEQDAVETASHAIVDTANENMANQIRLIAVDRGLDAREFTLVPFGGAGPVHGRACAELLGIRRMLVPPHPGLSSAFGAAVAHLRADRTQTFVGRLGMLDLHRFQTVLDALTRAALAELVADGVIHEPVVLRSLDMRYAGQNYEREVPIPDGPIAPETLIELERRFAEQHKTFYGFALEGEPVEAVLLRVTAIGMADGEVATDPPIATAPPTDPPVRPVAFRAHGYIETPIYRRETLPVGFTFTGPAIVEEPDSTTVIYPGDTCTVREDGMLDVELVGL